MWEGVRRVDWPTTSSAPNVVAAATAVTVVKLVEAGRVERRGYVGGGVCGISQQQNVIYI